jgi:predicted transcriptional regulator
MTKTQSTLLVTIDSDADPYEAGKTAIKRLKRGESVDQPATVTFPNEELLAATFNERTYALLNVIRSDEPASIRETARLVDRDKKNVYEELTTLESLGVIRFETDGQSKQPVFPYDELLIRPVGDPDTDTDSAAPA